MALESPYDFVIIGSGFGGSVSALRLREKGYSVAVLEAGSRFRDEDFPRTNWDLRRFLFAPLLRCFGIQRMTLMRDVMVLGGAGVGGGSLVYANTLLQPDDRFFRAPSWAHLADWRAELEPHYATARRMLGVVTNPALGFVDDVLKDCAEELGRGETFAPSQVGVYFGEPGVTVPDPYFGGAGPARTGCVLCGGCMVGCRYGAKNTLVKNYLWFAEKLGARIFPERTVTDVRPAPGGGYEVESRSTRAWLGIGRDRRVTRAGRVVFAAGVLGTVRLLLELKHVKRSLPRLSDRLGHGVRTNSEALLGLTALDAPPERDFSKGIAISSIFHADEHTHIEPVRYSRGSSFIRVLGAPMVDGDRPWLRPFLLLLAVLANPVRAVRPLLTRNWAGKSLILLVMQTLEGSLRLRLGRSLYSGFRRRLVTGADDARGGRARIPVYLPIAHRVARAFARRVDGIPQNAVNEVLLNIPTTAHILGGCAIGASPAEGVIDAKHEVFGHPGLYVCDGSMIPANLGVNPSLTITAMTERAMGLVGPKLGN